ncbi:uncharacterized protein BP01DRAFT_368957 [Aspergillus saccharolyticus JOP 1030-1]|uniref:TeaA receptor TeaR n=1 Tax=Aspergillus saccharolyticus JOP 1030-1 TaxID=1450539 RepID=A0A318Z539_9EURO|nr:hypothetical protein BP01DRAFT_368957 [Aspergillus saccharolyticus JOP 1030-1]PYH41477.1 hypothetical protein BP01DRAFT_368957 [Aspergillus saccharolyticus JOP 1030-1]
MAGTATATYSTDAWTSPTVDGGQWEFSVPIRQDSTNYRSKSRSSHDSRSRGHRQKGSRSSSLSRHVHVPDQTNARGRGDASHSRRESEEFGSQHHYGYEPVDRSANLARASVEAPRQDGPIKSGEGIGVYLEELDNEKWIHRDKLAKIESEELQQFFQRRAATDGPQTGRGRSHESHGLNGRSFSPHSPNEQMEPWPSLHDGSPRDSYDSRTFSDAGDHHDSTQGDREHWDLRRPEEIAADRAKEQAASGFYHNPGLRKSSSRIPLSKASPAPISPEHTGREFPMQRSRALTNGEDEVLSIGMPRRASEPMTVEAASSLPASGSRPGSRGFPSQNTAAKKTPAKAGPTNRKTSAPPATRKATPRARLPSNTQRPGARAGESRGPPNPINRPEGDPPWLATMYKPDPRLPPDQQILPTHARRMQQEQWAKEGKTPTMYDREFAPLAIGPDGPCKVERPKNERPEQEKPQVEEKAKDEPQLAPQPAPQPAPQQTTNEQLPPKEGETDTRPVTGSGYSTMPRVQEPNPAPLTPKWSPPVVTAQAPPPKEKGCGCCIVM